MNCFEWQNRASDHLDGTLIESLKREADQHLETCLLCAEHYKHYRLMLSIISEQPRSSLPVAIRKSPFLFTPPRIEASGRKFQWDRLPWPLKTTLEGLGVALGIFLVVGIVPRVRGIYEKSVERRLDSFHLADWMTSSDQDLAKDENAPGPLARGKTAPNDPDATHEEFATSEGEGDSDDAGAEPEPDTSPADTHAVIVSDDGTQIRIGDSEIWRFNIRTDSPHEIRTKLVKTLTDLNIPSSTPGLGGVEAPGGIQFDMLLPRTTVPQVMQQLQKLIPLAKTETARPRTATYTESFTWYRNRSKRKLAAGKTRVVIWLSQM